MCFIYIYIYTHTHTHTTYTHTHHIHILIIKLGHVNNGILPFAIMWMDPESITLIEISQTEKDPLIAMWYLKQ